MYWSSHRSTNRSTGSALVADDATQIEVYFSGNSADSREYSALGSILSGVVDVGGLPASFPWVLVY